MLLENFHSDLSLFSFTKTLQALKIGLKILFCLCPSFFNQMFAFFYSVNLTCNIFDLNKKRYVKLYVSAHACVPGGFQKKVSDHWSYTFRNLQAAW